MQAEQIVSKLSVLDRLDVAKCICFYGFNTHYAVEVHLKRLLKLTGIDFRHPDKGECKAAFILSLDQSEGPATGKKSLQRLMRYDVSHFGRMTYPILNLLSEVGYSDFYRYPLIYQLISCI